MNENTTKVNFFYRRTQRKRNLAAAASLNMEHRFFLLRLERFSFVTKQQITKKRDFFFLIADVSVLFGVGTPES